MPFSTNILPTIVERVAKWNLMSIPIALKEYRRTLIHSIIAHCFKTNSWNFSRPWFYLNDWKISGLLLRRMELLVRSKVFNFCILIKFSINFRSYLTPAPMGSCQAQQAIRTPFLPAPLMWEEVTEIWLSNGAGDHENRNEIVKN